MEADSMREVLDRYLELEETLMQWRVSHPEDSAEEDRLLEEMDSVWWKLTAEEMKWIDSRDPSCVGKGIPGDGL